MVEPSFTLPISDGFVTAGGFRLLARSGRSRKVEHSVSQLDLELRFKVITPGMLCVLGTATGSRKPLVPDTAS